MNLPKKNCLLILVRLIFIFSAVGYLRTLHFPPFETPGIIVEKEFNLIMLALLLSSVVFILVFEILWITPNLNRRIMLSTQTVDNYLSPQGNGGI